jgi:hypothetical protein
MSTRTAVWASGAALAAVGFVVVVVYLLQPWRSCDYDTSPAACRALPGDAAVMTAALWTVLAGLVVLLVGLCLPRSTSAPSRAAELLWEAGAREAVAFDDARALLLPRLAAARRRAVLGAVMLGVALAYAVVVLLGSMGLAPYLPVGLAGVAAWPLLVAVGIPVLLGALQRSRDIKRALASLEERRAAEAGSTG